MSAARVPIHSRSPSRKRLRTGDLSSAGIAKVVSEPSGATLTTSPPTVAVHTAPLGSSAIAPMLTLPGRRTRNAEGRIRTIPVPEVPSQ